MFFKLSFDQQQELRHIPETGMGYQLIEASYLFEYKRKEFIVLNSELIVENDNLKEHYFKQIFSGGFKFSALNASVKELREVKLINKIGRFSQLNERNENRSAAKDNPVIYPDGNAYFVRLSAYEDDKRIDKINNCLLPGSYTTTKKDYEKCVNASDDPVERYALPNDEKVEWAFHIRPKVKDGYRFGIVQPEFGKRGGGEECFFENGTSFGTFKMQTQYGVFYP